MQERKLENYKDIPFDVWQSVLDRVSPSLNGLFRARQTCRLFKRVVDERLKHKPVIYDYSFSKPELSGRSTFGKVKCGGTVSDAEDKLALICSDILGDFISLVPLQGDRERVSFIVPPLLPFNPNMPIYRKLLFRDNDRQLLAFTTRGNWVDVWDVQHGVLLSRRQCSNSNYFVTTPIVLRDGGLLFACTNDDNDWYLEWLNRDFESVRIFPLPDVRVVRSIVLSDDELKVAITYGRGDVRFARMVFLQPTLHLSNQLNFTLLNDTMHFMPDNLHFIARCQNAPSHLTIYSIETGKATGKFKCATNKNIVPFTLNKERSVCTMVNDGIMTTQLGEEPTEAPIQNRGHLDLLLFARQKIIHFVNYDALVWIPRAKQLPLEKAVEPVTNSLRK